MTSYLVFFFTSAKPATVVVASDAATVVASDAANVSTQMTSQKSGRQGAGCYLKNYYYFLIGTLTFIASGQLQYLL